MPKAMLHKAVNATLTAALTLLLTLGAVAARVPDDPRTAAGTLITNRAEATYKDEAGMSLSAVSDIMTITVRAVAAFVVSPDETQAVATVSPQERVTRFFQICNTGNTPDAYTLTRAEVTAPASIHELRFDIDNDGAVSEPDILARVNEGLSPSLAAGACVNVLAIIDTNDVAPQSALTIRLTAHSNVTDAVSGSTEDAGTIINAVGNSARLTDPNNAGLPPSKLVEDKERAITSAGQTLNYVIAFRNSGGTAARRVRMTDELPAGLKYIAGSLRLEGRVLSDADDADEGSIIGQRIEVRLNEVAVDAVVRIKFQARVTGEFVSGAAIINTAMLSGDNFRSSPSAAAVAVVDPFGTVYAGHSDGTVRISGARVALLTDQAGSALGLQPNTSFPPNEANDNPFLTDAQGRFSFALAPDQLGASTAPVRYFLSVTAPGYRGRMLEVTLLPTGNGVFEATVRALDDQSIARLGSFKLTSETVLIQNIASLALNIPLFETTPLEVTKSADKQNAEIGDIISYRISLRNATASVISDVAVRDQLPPSFHYAEGTARIEGGAEPMQAVEPELAADGTLLFKVGNLDAGANVTILYRVRVGANARDGEQFNSAIASGVYLSGERATTSPARVAVRVSRGVFSMRQVIIGRVFEDTDNNGQFDSGERPVAGVRLYLNNGQSVITDSAGQYNIPSVGEGSLVISLDPVTVPAGYALADDRRRSGRSWTRLLRTPLGGGALLRQNFALLPSNSSDNAASVALPSAITSSAVTPVSGSVPLAANDTATDTTRSTVSPAPAAPQAQALVKTDAATLNANARLLPAPKQPLTAGTYETVATDTIAP
ncbi:MAG: hypothetical protein M3R15_14430, partial [Acidobacteriota bacterium]|nr:hypothetical protein [Acidobacteriota bacterium]